jgi:hypothetical protein
MGLVQRVSIGDELELSLQSLIDDLRGKSGAVLRLTVKGLRENSLHGFH